MKGLLLKDWYMVRKYCRIYLLIIVIFLAVSCIGDSNLFFALYPCVLCGMIPVHLLGYDEKSGWVSYCGTLPYTTAQYVSAKYLTGLFATFAVLVVTAVTHTVRLALNHDPHFGNLLIAMLAVFALAAFSAAVCLPFVFRFGSEKGHIVYFAVTLSACVIIALFSDRFTTDLAPQIPATILCLILALAAAAVYALSWALSIALCKR